MRNTSQLLVIGTILLAATTSSIAFSLARSPKQEFPKKPLQTPLLATPWYCKPQPPAQISAGYKDGYMPVYNPNYKPAYKPAYQPTPGYYSPTPAYKPAYKPEYKPAYKPADTKPGYVAPPPMPPTPSNSIFDEQKLLSFFGVSQNSCPSGYEIDIAYLKLTCSGVLKQKLDGTQTAQPISPAMLATCQQLVKQTIWNSKINSQLCATYAAQMSVCRGKKFGDPGCPNFIKTLGTLGVPITQVAQVVNDLAAYCPLVY